MSLEEKVMDAMKTAMKSKDEAGLRGLRGIKAEIIKAKRGVETFTKNAEAAQRRIGYLCSTKPRRPG